MPHLKPVGHQSTNWMVRLVLMVATAAFTSFGTTSPPETSKPATDLHSLPLDDTKLDTASCIAQGLHCGQCDERGGVTTVFCGQDVVVLLQALVAVHCSILQHNIHIYHLTEQSGVVQGSTSFVKADRRRPEGCAVHHAAGHVLAVALAAGCYMPNRVSYPKPSKIHNFQTAAAVVMTQQGPAKWRGSHLTIMDAGSKTDMVISATDSCSWYAFSAEITGA